MNQEQMESPDDVIDFLKDQHEQIKGLFGKVLAAQGRQREQAFAELRKLMAIHETAEEEIVHPAARRALVDGESIVATRLHEENEAKQALSLLEKLDVGSMEFETRFRALKTAVLAHAESEEEEEFDELADELDDAQLRRMRKAVAFAESVAPTRPHPGVESAAGNMLAGPFVAMVDRVRDALTAKG
jgi:hemerythrin superfamily protein